MKKRNFLFFLGWIFKFILIICFSLVSRSNYIGLKAHNYSNFLFLMDKKIIFLEFNIENNNISIKMDENNDTLPLDDKFNASEKTETTQKLDTKNHENQMNYTIIESNETMNTYLNKSNLNNENISLIQQENGQNQSIETYLNQEDTNEISILKLNETQNDSSLSIPLYENETKNNNSNENLNGTNENNIKNKSDIDLTNSSQNIINSSSNSSLILLNNTNNENISFYNESSDESLMNDDNDDENIIPKFHENKSSFITKTAEESDEEDIFDYNITYDGNQQNDLNDKLINKTSTKKKQKTRKKSNEDNFEDISVKTIDPEYDDTKDVQLSDKIQKPPPKNTSQKTEYKESFNEKKKIHWKKAYIIKDIVGMVLLLPTCTPFPSPLYSISQEITPNDDLPKTSMPTPNITPDSYFSGDYPNNSITDSYNVSENEIETHFETEIYSYSPTQNVIDPTPAPTAIPPTKATKKPSLFDNLPPTPTPASLVYNPFPLALPIAISFVSVSTLIYALLTKRKTTHRRSRRKLELKLGNGRANSNPDDDETNPVLPHHQTV